MMSQSRQGTPSHIFEPSGLKDAKGREVCRQCKRHEKDRRKHTCGPQIRGGFREYGEAMKAVTITMNDGGIVDVDFRQWIMNEIEDKAFDEDAVAHTYSILIAKGVQDVGDINRAIINRWSKTALLRIKRKAWKRLNGNEAR